MSYIIIFLTILLYLFFNEKDIDQCIFEGNSKSICRIKQVKNQVKPCSSRRVIIRIILASATFWTVSIYWKIMGFDRLSPF